MRVLHVAARLICEVWLLLLLLLLRLCYSAAIATCRM